MQPDSIVEANSTARRACSVPTFLMPLSLARFRALGKHLEELPSEASLDPASLLHSKAYATGTATSQSRAYAY